MMTKNNIIPMCGEGGGATEMRKSYLILTN